MSSSTRRAALNALAQVFEKVAPGLDVTADQLEIGKGTIQVKGNPDRSLTWRKAAARIGPTPITASGKNPGPGKLNDSGVGGVQMADVSVDVETGIVKTKPTRSRPGLWSHHRSEDGRKSGLSVP